MTPARGLATAPRGRTKGLSALMRELAERLRTSDDYIRRHDLGVQFNREECSRIRIIGVQPRAQCILRAEQETLTPCLHLGYFQPVPRAASAAVVSPLSKLIISVLDAWPSSAETSSVRSSSTICHLSQVLRPCTMGGSISNDGMDPAPSQTRPHNGPGW
jgi:hypothetical protein